MIISPGKLKQLQQEKLKNEALRKRISELEENEALYKHIKELEGNAVNPKTPAKNLACLLSKPGYSLEPVA